MPANNGYCFCFAFPLTAKSFDSAIIDRKKDFIHHFLKYYQGEKNTIDWLFYENKIVKPYQLLKSRFTKYGFDFVDECTWNKFQAVTEKEYYKVIILFSHCINNGKVNESIEFFDELVTSENMLKAILDIERIYDFSVCKPEYLRNLMKIKRTNAVCGTSSKFIPVILWIYIYAEIFATVQTEQVDFLEAMYITKSKYKNNNNE